MSNLLQRIKNTSLFFTGVLSHHFKCKLLDPNEKGAQQLAQEVRDQKNEVVAQNVLEIKDEEVSNVLQSLSKNLPINTTNNNTNNRNNDDIIQSVSDKTDDTNNLGTYIDQLLKTDSLNEQEVKAKIGESVSKILNNANDIQNFIVEYFSSNSTDGGVKNFIGGSNFNLESLSAYLDSLSLLQESALLHICILITILIVLINIFAALFANEILNYFDLENKYPSISGFLKLRAKLQKYYLTWNILLLLIIILATICIDILVFVTPL